MNSDTHRSDSRQPEQHRAQLQRSLYETALRLRASEALADRARLLRRLGLAGLPLLAIGFAFPQHAAACLYLIAALCMGGLVYAWFKYQDRALDYLAAARRIEAEHPELKQVLVTAIERELQGDSNFLSERVTAQALAHPSRPRWDETGRAVASASRLQYLGTLSGVLLLLAASFFAAQRERAPGSGTTAAVSAADTNVQVLPGDAEVERGSSLVVTARFQGRVPSQATLVALSDDGVESRFPMAQSLSDPVFAHTLQRVEKGLRYRIEYADAGSESFRLQVYDLPRLGRADAHLDYPDYTGWPDRVIEDTQRLSAIEGTALDYFFNTNKPLREAYLVDPEGQRIELAAVNDDRTRFQFSQTLSESARYTLQFTDDADRRNDYSPEIRIDVQPNKRPALRLTNPRGDQRVSPIQELSLRGEASDDFGLLDYGVALVIGAEPPRQTSLMDPNEEEDVLSATLSHLVALEEYQLQPKDALSWYLWAEDYGPDGERRRSTSDLFFADVRALDEIFREQDGGGGGQTGQGNAGQNLLEKQKRVSISLFRIKNTATRPESSVEDLDVVQRSQIEVIDELRQLVPQLQDPSARDNAADALRFMEGVDVSLNTAIDRPTLSTLDVAWSDSQGAYQALVKLTESEFNVARSQNQQGGGGSGSSRNQAQLNELEFRQEENRYETASQAQALSSPEERQNLELMSKLNELSRRQEDMNTRLQEMQSALAEARSEEERERIRRELKRLEEEQRQLLADADEAIQQTGTRQSARDARQQLEQARENMQRASDQLEREDVSQALASGTRAQDTLDNTREQMRNRNSSQFSEAMRQARSRARELSDQQQEIESELERLGEETRRSLDDSEAREAVAQSLDGQSQQVEDFLEELQGITAGAEAVEPGLYRQLYQVLRESDGARFEERYGTSAQLLRQGFLDDARQNQSGLGEEIEALSERIAEAAESILGDEGTTLQYAQNELESLREQLERERPSEPSGRSQRSQERRESQASNQAQDSEGDAGQSNTQATPSPGGAQDGQPDEGQSPQQAQAPRSASGQPRSGGGGGGGLGGATSLEEFIQNAIADLENATSGPLTGSGFSNWIDRLSTVESLIDDPLARARVSEAREQAENLRRDFKRHGALPQWEMVEDAIASPLDDVRGWLAEELNRIENPESLQPVDRDPVPQEYLEIVRRYYESLGEE